MGSASFAVRPNIRRLAVAALAVAVAAPLGATSQPAKAASGQLLFGVAGDMTVEGKSGTTFSLHRVFGRMGRSIISSKVRGDAAAGRVSMVSMFPNARWSAIASGKADAELRREAADVKSFGRPILLNFNHEPENDDLGSPADFVAAFRRFVKVYRSVGVTNAKFGVILMQGAFRNSRSTSFYPGDDYVDWIGADAYNWTGCRTGKIRSDKWHSFHDMLAPAYAFTAQHRKEFYVPEYGTPEDRSRPTAKAQWFKDVLATAKAWPNLRGVAYFNHGASRDVPLCDFRIGSSSASLNAFQSIANDSYIRPAA